jgi:hypothetical protein
VRLRIALERVHRTSRCHSQFSDLDELTAAIEVIVTGRHDGREVDFLDGVVFSPTQAYLVLGSWTDTGETADCSDYTGLEIYYRSLPEREFDTLTVHDYLWRWDTDWFWCSKAFGAQHPPCDGCGPPDFGGATSITGSSGWRTVTTSRLDSTPCAGDRPGSASSRTSRCH